MIQFIRWHLSLLALLYPTFMYLLVYPSLSVPQRVNAPAKPARPVSISADFVTPDGLIVPRALAEAALVARTAVLVGDLLVGVWPQA